MGVGGFFKTVGKVAYPMITVAAQAGGPFTAMAAQQVGKALGLDKAPEATPEAIEAAMSKAALDPASQVALAKGEQDFQVSMETLTNGKIKNAQDFEAHLLEIDAADRASARNREITVKDKIPAVLAIVVSLGFFISLWWVFGHGVKPESHDLATIMLTTLATAWVSIIAYYFGSSAGSDRKTELLAQAPSAAK